MNKLISSCKWYLLSTKNLPTIEQVFENVTGCEKFNKFIFF